MGQPVERAHARRVDRHDAARGLAQRFAAPLGSALAAAESHAGRERAVARTQLAQGPDPRGLPEPGAVPRRDDRARRAVAGAVRQGAVGPRRARGRDRGRPRAGAKRGTREDRRARVPDPARHACRAGMRVARRLRAARRRTPSQYRPRRRRRPRPALRAAHRGRGQAGGRRADPHDARCAAAALRARHADARADRARRARAPAQRAGRRGGRDRQRDRRDPRVGRLVGGTVERARRRRRARAASGRLDAQAVPLCTGARREAADGRVAARRCADQPRRRRRPVHSAELRQGFQGLGERAQRARWFAERAGRAHARARHAAPLRAHADRTRPAARAGRRLLRLQPRARQRRRHAAVADQRIPRARERRRRAQGRRPAGRGADGGSRRSGARAAGRRHARVQRGGQFRRHRHPVRQQCARAHVRLRQPARDALLFRGQDRHEQGHARQLDRRFHVALYGRRMGRQCGRLADVGRVGRHGRVARVVGRRRLSAPRPAEPCAACAGRRRDAPHRVRARHRAGPQRVVHRGHGGRHDPARGARHAGQGRRARAVDDRRADRRHDLRDRPGHSAEEPADLVRALVRARGEVRVAARRQGDRACRSRRVAAMAGPAPARTRRCARQRRRCDRLRGARRVREAGRAQALRRRAGLTGRPYSPSAAGRRSRVQSPDYSTGPAKPQIIVDGMN
ncbi:Membrane carboxypeptidase/penicillin-binding protein PbpC [Burkholderia cenocepacia]|nr:Membrane carboxypeptidase/penicillin-binding protein PbpC [Burkholderia cenocepacia]